LSFYLNRGLADAGMDESWGDDGGGSDALSDDGNILGDEGGVVPEKDSDNDDEDGRFSIMIIYFEIELN